MEEGNKKDPKLEALKLLKSIKTFDDLVKHKDEILDFIEESIRYGIESLKSVLNMSLSAEELQAEMAKLNLGEDFLGEEIEKELDRLANLPGAKEFIADLRNDMEKRLEPYAHELMELMGKIMGTMMGQIMGNLGEVMNEAFSGFNGESKVDAGFEDSEDEQKEKKEEENEND